MVVGGAQGAGGLMLGATLAFAGACTYAAYVLVISTGAAGLSAFAITAVVLPTAAVGLTAYAILTGRFALGFGVDGWLWLAFHGTLMLVAVGSFIAGMTRIGAVRASLLDTAQPVLAVAFAMWLLAEVVTPLQGLGGLLVVLGIGLVVATTRETATPGAP